MKQNFLLKSFVLLIALLAGGISASWGQDVVWDFTDLAAQSFEDGKTYSFMSTDNTKEMRYSAGSSAKADNKDGYLKENGKTGGATVKDIDGTTDLGKTRLIRLFVTGKGNLTINCNGTNGAYKVLDGSASGTTLISSLAANTESNQISVSSSLWIETTTKGYITTIKWSPSAAATEAFTVTFNAGDYGTCATASLKETSAGAGVTLPAVTPTDGYTFNGWFTAATGGSKAGEAGATYYPTANVTLHAQYTEPVAEPTYKSDFTDGQVIWTTKDEIDAASSGSSPWIVKGDGISNTKDLKGKSFVNPEDEEGDRIAKYSSETPFYIEKTISNKQDLKLYVTGVTRMTFYVWSNSTPDGRVFSIKVNDGDVTNLTFADGDYKAKYVSVDLEKTANNIIQVYASIMSN